MTIGPEPITSTDERSVRRGMVVYSPVSDRGADGVATVARWARRWSAERSGSGARGRAGVPGGGHHLDEGVEQVGGVVRTGGGLGVELDAERGAVQQSQPLDHVVVEADVADLGAAVRGVERAVEVGADREAVVLAGDVDASGAGVADRLVDPAVAEGQLVGLQSQGPSQDLVAEADA